MGHEDWTDNPDFPPSGWSSVDWKIYLDAEEDEDAD